MNARAEVDAVPARGYRWWYVDGLSDDGRQGFTAIYMFGHVFSPWRARRHRQGEPIIAREHLGMHVALYEAGREVAWAMTEYDAAGLEVAADHLRLGGSTLRIEGQGVAGAIDEKCAPIFWSRLGLGTKLRGGFSLTPTAAVSGAPSEFEIGRSATGEAHRWQVRVPSGRIRVDFDAPRFSFEGRGYHDTNWGEGRLEDAFTRWSWARFHEPERSRILYGVEGRDGATRGFYVEAGSAGAAARASSDVRFGAVESTGWGLRTPRGFSIGETERADVVRWLDRTPFYARYVARLGGVEGVGEYLDLDRLQRPAVQFLLRWRGHRG